MGRFISFATCSSAALLGLSQPSFAQDQSAEPAVPKRGAAAAENPAGGEASAALEGVVVTGVADRYVAKVGSTASKTDTPIIETPFSVSTITQKDMEDRQANLLVEIVTYSPGVNAGFQVGTTTFDRVRIRGFSGGNTIFYLDGLTLPPPAGYSVAQVDAAHLQSVDVLRGPSSGLYGQSSAGGIINQVSKLPMSEANYRFSLTLGNRDYKDATLDVGGRVGNSDKFSYRVTGTYLDYDVDAKGKEVRYYSVVPAVTWRPTDKTSWTVMAGLRKDEDGVTSTFLPISGTATPNVNGLISRTANLGDPSFDKWKRSQVFVQSILTHAFNDSLSFRQTARWMDVDVDTDYIWLNNSAFTPDRRSYRRYFTTRRSRSTGWAVDNFFNYKVRTGSLNHTIIAGLDARRFDIVDDTNRGQSTDFFDVFSAVNGNLVVPAIPVERRDRTELTQTGVYVQDQIAIGNFRISGSLRYDWAKFRLDNLLNGAVTEYKSAKLTGRAGVVYLFDSGLAPYLSYATSFEPANGVDYFGKTFVPTVGDQIEGGVRFQPPNSNLLISAAVFQIKQNNVLTTDIEHSCSVVPTVPRCGSYSVQTGQVRSKGVELEGKASLMAGLNATVSYTYLDMEVTRSNTNNLGKTPTNAPKHWASGWLSYSFGNGQPLRGLTVGGGVRVMGPMWINAVNTLKLPSFTVVDAMASYDLSGLDRRFSGLQLSVNAANLTDSHKLAGCYSEGICDYLPSRSVRATLSYSF